MLKRKIYQSLLKWKNSANKKCLLVKGARQVGKTFIIRAFGEREYESFIEINFLLSPDLRMIFDGELSGDEIFKRISAFMADARIIPGKTLLFLDEIQKCPKARTALKFLTEDARLDVVASGSLLGLSYGRDDDPDVGPVESIPVGYETTLMMYSLDFEEFLWAYGYEDSTISYLRSFYEQHNKVLPELNRKFEAIVREFIVVGGMPEVVDDFIRYKDFNRVHDIQARLLSDYEDDIAGKGSGACGGMVREKSSADSGRC